MDKTVDKSDLSLVPEIRNFHPLWFHSFHNEPRHPSPRDSTDLLFNTDRSPKSPPGFAERISAIAKDNCRSVFITIVVVLVILLETALDNGLFKCPCTSRGTNIGYSVIFVIGPAATLLIIGKNLVSLHFLIYDRINSHDYVSECACVFPSIF